MKMPNAFLYLIIKLKVSPSAHVVQDEGGVFRFESAQNSYLVQVSNSTLRQKLSILLTDGLRWPIEEVSDPRASLLFRVLEDQLAARGMVEYEIMNGALPSVIIQSDRRLQLRSFPAFSPLSTFQLRAGTAVLVESGGIISIVNPHQGVRIRLCSVVYAVVSTLLSVRNSKLTVAQSELALLLVACGCIVNSDELPAVDSSDVWKVHDRLFHYLSRCADFNSRPLIVERTSTPPEATLLWAGEQVARPELLAALRARESRRFHNGKSLGKAELCAFFEFLLERNTNKSGQEKRNFPSAGGFYNYRFYVVVGACEGMDPAIYHVSLPGHGAQLRFESISTSFDEVFRALHEAAAAWGMPQDAPSALVFVSVDNADAVAKYGDKAYRLALLNGGVLVQTMYLLTEALGMPGCAIGNGSRHLESILRRLYPEHVMLVEFAIGGRSNPP